LDLSKIEAGHVEFNLVDFDLGLLVRDICNMFRHRVEQKSIRLDVDLSRTARCMVRGDQRKLTQVLINLLGNAIKFTDAGYVALRVNNISDQFHFEVADTGIGIPVDFVDTIFEPFQQAHGSGRGGSGLGLAIAARHVELMGGTLRCSSASGAGSKFDFSIALAPGRSSGKRLADAVLMPGAVRMSDGPPVRALVVDDVLENRQVLAEMLRAVGCIVQTCETGEEAIEAVNTFTPHIAFIDIMMMGMDGHEVVGRILARHGNSAPRLVATTAAALIHDQDRLRMEGFCDVLIKPLRMERVYLCLTTWLGVEFESVDEVGPSEKPHTTPPLPPHLRHRLLSAAESHSVTEVRQTLVAIEQLGEEYASLAVHLRALLGSYDLPSIARFAVTLQEHDASTAEVAS
ncbi:MAG: response regulator, partial [Phycisphaerae bacterium]|nr:response regulator [Phycisphaerae bacterium]